ncbi:sugar transferase [Mediterraneibacter glycyrrhizinilyticus]|nr:sugar transferase [Mediterraneibacter glycyrrhizinilyticus]MBM6751516.1 sugar transferase [Mediterraneibacter glycyrrhizinilyticus]
MYSKISNSWLKHWDFIILDILMLQLAYIFSCVMRRGLHNPYEDPLYQNIAVIICLADICSAFFMEPYHGIMRRGYFMEFKNTLKHVFLVAVFEVIYLFLSQSGEEFSRLSFLWFIPAAIVLVYLERIIWKTYLLRRKRLFYEKLKLLLVTTREEIESTLERVRINSFNEFEIIGIAFADSSAGENEKIRNIPVVCGAADIPDYIQTRWVDAVLFATGKQKLIPEGLVNTCIKMGVTVHYRLEQLEGWTGNQYINRMGGYTVLTSSLRFTSARQVFMKRALDILGGLVGILITGIITIFLAPAIYIASPGPVFFSQVRVGKNGKRFKIYKFRSMYMDAEERKKELMAKNEMQGFMFKMDADPRIIGSGPDGTRHGLGWFIRKTSLDEFPQFLNVLKGDMSLVGTRPPTEDEWKQYKYYHRARLATKPGLTGMWQVSGRSDITDFEEVVKLDMEYIKNWNIGMDIKIILKTVLVVLKGSGSK